MVRICSLNTPVWHEMAGSLCAWVCCNWHFIFLEAKDWQSKQMKSNMLFCDRTECWYHTLLTVLQRVKYLTSPFIRLAIHSLQSYLLLKRVPRPPLLSRCGSHLGCHVIPLFHHRPRCLLFLSIRSDNVQSFLLTISRKAVCVPVQSWLCEREVNRSEREPRDRGANTGGHADDQCAWLLRGDWQLAIHGSYEGNDSAPDCEPFEIEKMTILL